MFLALYVPAIQIFGVFALFAPVVVKMLLSMMTLVVSGEAWMGWEGMASLQLYGLLLSFIVSAVIGLIGAAFPNRTKQFIRALNATPQRE